MIPNMLMRSIRRATAAPVATSRVFSLLENGLLNPIATNIGTTVSAAGVRFLANQYVVFPHDVKYSMAAKEFAILAKFTIHNNVNGTGPAAGTSVTTLLSWNGWLAPGTTNNYEFVINNLTNTISFSIGNTSSLISTSFNYSFVKNREYAIRLERVGNSLILYVDGVKINQVAFAHNVAINMTSVMRIGRRVGGANNAYWDADMTVKELTLDVYDPPIDVSGATINTTYATETTNYYKSV